MFSSDDDEFIADPVCIWIADTDHAPPGLCAHLTKRIKRDTPFAQRLRRGGGGIYAIGRTWHRDPMVLGLEILSLLNCLNVNSDGVQDAAEWVQLLILSMSPAASANGGGG